MRPSVPNLYLERSDRMAHFSPPPPPFDDPETVWGHFLRALPIIGPVVIFLTGCLWFVIRKMAGNLFDRYEKLISDIDALTEKVATISASLAVKDEQVNGLETDLQTLALRQLDHEKRISHVEGACSGNHGRKH